MREIIIEEFKGYRTTTDLDIALVNNYIGENYLRPNKLCRFIHWYFTREYLRIVHFYYYGKPTPYLKKVFGYNT